MEYKNSILKQRNNVKLYASICADNFT